MSILISIVFVSFNILSVSGFNITINLNQGQGSVDTVPIQARQQQQQQLFQQQEAREVRERFLKENIVKHVIDLPPLSRLHVEYENGIKVSLGNRISRRQAFNKPDVIAWEADPNKYHTMVLVDADPTSKTFAFLGQMNHWMIINIVGNDWTTGEEIISYRPPGPPPLTGMHRFIFLVYEQKDKMTTVDRLDVRRIGFSIKTFARRYNLTQPPIAGDFFKSEFTLRY